MEFRKLEAGDAEAWWWLRLEALETEPLVFGKSPEEHRATTIADTAERLRGVGAGPGSFTLGAFDADRLAAIATFSRALGLKEQHKGHIYGVYVSTSYRGRGIGSHLLRELLDRVREDASVEQVLLGVGTHNVAALQTYRKLGFEIYGTEPRALRVGSHEIDEHLMVLMLGKRE
jgi:ribosomal protein S18 acetylase RimI-like enzyme